MTATDKIKLAKQASSVLAQSNSNLKNAALLAIAQFLTKNTDAILEANSKDLEAAAKNGLAAGLRDRLTLNGKRIDSLVEALLQVASLPDPVGNVYRGMTLPNGLRLTQVAVPFGVVGAIYEARPNVTIDIAALALKAGNAVVLRGGSAAENTNLLLVSLMQAALESVGLPSDCVQSVDDFGRKGAVEMMQARGLIDVLIPRGSASLIKAVVDESKVPVIETGDGVVHIFIDETARLDWSVEIVHNSKVQRPSVCNALETLLIHEGAVDRVGPAILDRLSASGVTIHGDERVLGFFPSAVAATEEDWKAEYYSLDLAVRVVSSLDEALEHIAKYSTHHTESIITEDASNSERFLNEVDSAVVMANAATRFTDGSEFGFGAEVGISTQKLHARGPMGLPELTSTKWIVRGDGQTRV
jgi:glutamate-5-semialdehyde dehydrogenase